jgi:hypothetical protein
MAALIATGTAAAPVEINEQSNETTCALEAENSMLNPVKIAERERGQFTRMLLMMTRYCQWRINSFKNAEGGAEPCLATLPIARSFRVVYTNAHKNTTKTTATLK